MNLAHSHTFPTVIVIGQSACLFIRNGTHISSNCMNSGAASLRHIEVDIIRYAQYSPSCNCRTGMVVMYSC
jgi:hypothetical protein